MKARPFSLRTAARIVWLAGAIGLCPVSARAEMTCSGPEGPPLNPMTSDYTCTGDLTISAGETLVVQGDLTLSAAGRMTVNGTVVLDSNGTNSARPYSLISAMNLSVGAGGVIHADGTGCGPSMSYDGSIPGCVNKGSGVTGGFGEGSDDTVGNRGAGGGGYGGPGGPGALAGAGAGGFDYGTADLGGFRMGSGGGSHSLSPGGAGGGSIRISVADTLSVSGVIRADGLPGSGGMRSGGGGSGGSLFIETGTLSGSGVIRANGGRGGSNSTDVIRSGGGGGGRVRVTILGADLFAGSFEASGGSAAGPESTQGRAGSVAVYTAADRRLRIGGNGPLEDGIDGANDGVQNYGRLEVGKAGFTGVATRDLGTLSLNQDLNIEAESVIAAGLVVAGDRVLHSNVIRVLDGGSLILDADGTNPERPYSRITAGTITVETGGAIHADGRGCGSSQSYDPSLPGCANTGIAATPEFGEGGDDTVGNRGAGGGGYGGGGGNSNSAGGGASGSAYGSADLTRLALGSGGGTNATACCAFGGAGGGAIRIEAADLTVDGMIRANGSPGSGVSKSGGGGSGGSILIEVRNLSGNGRIQAGGGAGGALGTIFSGGGGGGRVRVTIAVVDQYAGTFEAAGGATPGSEASQGRTGSVVVYTATDRRLRIGGNGPLDDVIDGANDGVQRYGRLEVVKAGASGLPARDRGIVTMAADLAVDTDVVVSGGLAIAGDRAVAMAAARVTEGGNLILDADGTNPAQPYSRITAETITVEAGGAIHADGRGCGSSESYDYDAADGTPAPGCRNLGPDVSDRFGEGRDAPFNAGGGGGGFGGSGGGGDNGSTSPVGGGHPYGEAALPVPLPGSGGGRGSTPGNEGGSGGGAVRLEVSGALTVEGEIRADGANGTGASRTGGGGSGGSLYITAGGFGGNGILSAVGGDGGGTGLSGGGGSGGRIRLEVAGPDAFLGSCAVFGGRAPSNGVLGEPGSALSRQRPDARLDGNGSNEFGAPGTGAGGRSAILAARPGTVTPASVLEIFNRDGHCAGELQSFRISWALPGIGWTVALWNGDTPVVESPFVTGAVPHQSSTLNQVTVTPPAGAAAGLYDIVLDIQSVSNEALADSVMIRVQVSGGDGIIDGRGDDLFGPPGSGGGGTSSRIMTAVDPFATPRVFNTAIYSLTAQNDSGAAQSFTLTWNEPAEWTVRLFDGTAERTSGFTTASIGPGGSVTYELRVLPLPDATEGQTMIVDILSPGGGDSVKAVAVIPARPDAPVICEADGLPHPACVGPAAVSGSTIHLFWIDASNNETGFRIERADQAGGACGTYGLIFTQLRDSFGSSAVDQLLSHADGSVAPGRTYCYRVLAFNPAGGAYSSAVQVSTGDFAPPSAPANLFSFAVDPHRIDLIWQDTSDNEDGFELERAGWASGSCDGEESYSRIALLGADTTAFGDIQAAEATPYCYRIRAINPAGLSAYVYSNRVETPSAGNGPPPGTVGDLAVAAGSQQTNLIGLVWTAPPNDADCVSGCSPVSAYDLRYSMRPIQDGPEDSHIDHVHFDDRVCSDPHRPIDCAVKVIHLGPPQAAGSLEFRAVGGRILEGGSLRGNAGECDTALGEDDPATPTVEDHCLLSNTTYFFALKSADQRGFPDGASDLSSPIAGGDPLTDGRLAGRTALRPTTNLVSLPGQPLPPDPVSVFMSDGGAMPQILNWRPGSSGPTVGVDGCYDSYPGPSVPPCSDITEIVPGNGYAVSGVSAPQVLDLPALSAPVPLATHCGLDDSFAVPLGLGFNMVGLPFATDRSGTGPALVFLSSAVIRQIDPENGSVCKGWADAAGAGWVDGALGSYNGSGTVPLTITSTPPGFLEPWKGYWLFVCNDPDGAGPLDCSTTPARRYELILQRP